MLALLPVGLVCLAPPVLSPKDAEGRPRKMAFGGWMLSLGFPTLARLKVLRGTPFDPMGYTAERRMERKLASTVIVAKSSPMPKRRTGSADVPDR